MPDPLWEKYVSLTPYQYAGNNPVSYFDYNGKIIEFCGDRQRSFDDFKACIPEAFIDRVSMNDEGLLQINTDGYEIGSSKEFDAIIKINSVPEKFGYETDTEAIKYRDGIMLNNYRTTSTTSFWIGTEWEGIRSSKNPPLGFDGYVKINSNAIFKYNGTEIRGQVIGHELLESYKRTIYKINQPDAHLKTNDIFFGGSQRDPIEIFDKIKIE